MPRHLLPMHRRDIPKGKEQTPADQISLRAIATAGIWPLGPRSTKSAAFAAQVSPPRSGGQFGFTRRWCMCGRPLGCKRENENFDGRIDCDHVSGLLTRLMTAGPDGVRDPVPNTWAASKACAPNGFSGSSVRPIVISFSSFIPAATRSRTVLDGYLSAFPRVIVARASRANSLVNPADESG
jgi:hypothetical protein